MVKFSVILSLTLSMSFKKTTGGKKTTLSTHLATAKLFHNTKNTGTCRSQAGNSSKISLFPPKFSHSSFIKRQQIPDAVETSLPLTSVPMKDPARLNPSFGARVQNVLLHLLHTFKST